MKRGMAFLLATALVVMCVPALAVSYTVDEKFWGQAGNMAVKGTVTFSVTGNETAAMDAETFQLLKSTLPGSIITDDKGNLIGLTIAQQASMDWIERHGTADTPEAMALRSRIQTLFERSEGTMN